MKRHARNIVLVCALGCLAASLLGDGALQGTWRSSAAEAKPSIQITSLSAYGEWPGFVSGRVVNVDPTKYKLTAMVFISGLGFFTKPYCDSTTTPLQSDGSFRLTITTGGADDTATRIALLVVPVAMTVACQANAPAIDEALEKAAVATLLLVRLNPREREISFAGVRWTVKASRAPVGPGPNFFSDSNDNVFVDSLGRLHLKITHRQDAWFCAEVVSRIPFGYGTYTITLESRPVLDSSVVFGAFTWADAERSSREIDLLEIGKFGRPASDATNAQTVVQPWQLSGHLDRFVLPDGAPTTHVMRWEPGRVTFTNFVGDAAGQLGAKIHEFVYPSATADVPRPDSPNLAFRLNLWLYSGPPTDGREAEVVVKNFKFEPLQANVPDARAVVDGASFRSMLAPGAIVSIFGTGLAAGTEGAQTTPLPLTLGGTAVKVNDIAAPLFYVSPYQINAQLPLEIAAADAMVTVGLNGVYSQPVPILVAPAAPAFFPLGERCAAQNSDGSLNTAEKPAKPGEAVVLYLTGIGQVDNPVLTGLTSHLTPLSRAVLPASVSIDGRTVLTALAYLGLTPGLVGLGQANVNIPADLPAGEHAVGLTINGVSSNFCRVSTSGLPGPPLVITGLDPSTGLEGGGTRVLINGTGFQIGATVRFGATPASSAVFLDPTGLEATAPPGSGVVDVTVLNPDKQSATLRLAFTYRKPPPTPFRLEPNAGPETGGTLVTITGSDFQSGAKVQFGAAAATSVSFASSGSLQATTPAGSGTVDVVVANSDGLFGTLSKAFTYRKPPPVITSVSPNGGPPSGGTRATVTGSGFQIGATVQFGTVAATNVTYVSSSSLQATTPAGSGPVEVKVTNPDGQSATLAQGFVYRPPPVPTSVSPNVGPPSGGTRVTITGSGFLTGATVQFGTAAATNVTFSSSTSLQATTPAGSGTVDVKVTNPDGQSATLALGFIYRAGPVITSVSPNGGPPSGGTRVTITGSGFLSGATVQFGMVAATNVTFSSSTSLLATTPAGSGPVEVKVTNPDGQSAALALGFVYRPPPVITSISPNGGPPSGGTPVTITGSGFVSGATVRFGTAAAASVTFSSSTSLQATTPAGSGTVDIKVTNPDGQSATLLGGFSYGTTITNPWIRGSLQACTVIGTVGGVDPPNSFRAVVYAKTDRFYIQPCDFQKTQVIGAQGSWGPIASHNGEIYALLVSGSYDPPATAGALPAVDGVNVLAQTGSLGTLAGCDVPACPAR